MKLLLNYVPFLFLATLRVLASLIFLTIYFSFKHISLHYSYKVKAIFLGFLAIYLNFFLTFLGMGKVKGVDNAFMNALGPVMTFFFSILLLKKKGNYKEYFAIVLTVFAFLLSIEFQIFSLEIGFVYLFLGMVLYMLANVFVQKWKLHNSLTLSFYELVFGFIFLLIHCLVKGQFQIQILSELPFIYWLLFFVVSGIGFAYIQVTYIKSIGIIGALRTSFFLSLNPVITYIESLLFLKEEFDWIHFVSFILVGVAIYIINGQKEKEISSLFRNNE